MIAEYITDYKKSSQELEKLESKLQDDVYRLNAYLLQSLICIGMTNGVLSSSTTTTTTLTKEVKEIKHVEMMKQQIQTLQQEKKTMEKKFSAERALLESKVELHKKSAKFAAGATAAAGAGPGVGAGLVLGQIQAPNSNVSNKLIHNRNISASSSTTNNNTNTFSTTPYLQKIQAIKQSRVTPINAKRILQASNNNFTTSTPDTSTMEPPKSYPQQQQQQQSTSTPSSSSVLTPSVSGSRSGQVYNLKKKNITSPLRALLNNASTKSTRSTPLSRPTTNNVNLFEHDENEMSLTREEETTSDKKFKKIKLSSQNKRRSRHNDAEDDDDEEDDDEEQDNTPKSPVLKRLKFGTGRMTEMSPLKTNNIFKV